MSPPTSGYQIPNWRKYQHYNPEKRNPPWVKLHTSVLNDRTLASLDLASVGLLMLLWALASESPEGRIPGDLEELRFRLRRPKFRVEDLAPLLESGFLIPAASDALAERLHDASTLQAGCEQDASTLLPRARGGAPAAARASALFSSSSSSEKETSKETDSSSRSLQRSGGVAARNGDLRKKGVEVLEHLNGKASRSFDLDGANLELVLARLREGRTVGLLCKIVSVKCREWGGDEKMAKYLRPKTLFNRTNVAQYAGELPPEVHAALLLPDDDEEDTDDAAV